MRTVIQVVRRLHWLQERGISSGRVTQLSLVNLVQKSSSYRDQCVGNLKFSPLPSRTLYTPTAKDTTGDSSGVTLDVNRSGPLVEYERRIAAGELVDGDKCQIHKGLSDPLEVVAREVSDESLLLCLDEFMVADVADALILNRLFRHLFRNIIILVSTSNRAPDRLYEIGLQRDLFLPFIATLTERCVTHEIGSSVDYRKLTSGKVFISLEKEKSYQAFLSKSFNN